jgi:hypothetical protein
MVYMYACRSDDTGTIWTGRLPKSLCDFGDMTPHTHNVAKVPDFPTIRNREASGLTTRRAQISRALLSLKLVLYGTVMRAQALHRAKFDAQRASKAQLTATADA